MEMTLKKENYSGYTAIWSGVSVKEFGNDCVIPDSMPDVRTVIDAEGTVLLRSRDTEGDRVFLEASVSAVILYLPEGEGPVKSLPVTIPVRFEMDAPGVSAADENLRSVFRLRLRALDAHMMNSRKISLRADVEAEATCYQRNTFSIAYDLEEGQTPTHLRIATAPAASVCDIKEKIFVITDNYPMPSGRGAERILSQRVEVFPEAGKFVSGKVVFRGKVKAAILFGDGNGEPVCSEQYETEFSQILEVEGEGDVQPDVQLALTGVYLDMPDPSDPQGRVAVEIHLAAQCICRQNLEIRYIADAYSNCVHLLPETEAVEVFSRVKPISMRQTVTGKAEPAVNDGEVLNVSAIVGAVSRVDGGVKTAVSIRVLSRGRNGQYAVSRCRLNAEFTLDIPEDCELGSICVKASDVYFVAGSGSADARVTLQLDGILLQQKKLMCVGSIEEDECDVRDYDNYPSLTFVRCERECDLWALAKKYHSTVESITLANEGKGEGLLLIPKTR